MSSIIRRLATITTAAVLGATMMTPIAASAAEGDGWKLTTDGVVLAAPCHAAGESLTTQSQKRPAAGAAAKSSAAKKSTVTGKTVASRKTNKGKAVKRGTTAKRNGR